MKSLRKTLNSNKDTSSIRYHISTPLPIPPVSKPPTSLLPPQKVIRAIAPYRSQAPQELSFQKGDFFYVLRDVNQAGSWYEAHNPVTGARGLVPRSLFEEFAKGINALRTSQVGGPAIVPVQVERPRTADPVSPTKSPKPQAFYAIVLHDFAAERPDELDAKRGDPISVVAQSNREWFVAKPIGRLGRPGLIPVTFVEVRDPVTNQPIPDVGRLMDRGDLPKVEDWKRAMLNYKQNSITLGVLEDLPIGTVPTSPLKSQFAPTGPPIDEEPLQEQLPPADASSPESLPEGVLLSANVVSYHYEMEEFWFRIDAIYQPFPPPTTNVLPSARHLILFRVYNDFYDFQVAMLQTFPREAGRVPSHPRILPFMPGPTEVVDNAVTATRRVELAEYLHKLCDLNESGNKHILEHQVIRSFLSLRPGDVENFVEARVEEMEAFYGPIFGGGPGGYGPVAEVRDDYVSDVRNAFSQMRLSDRDGRNSQGSEYDEGYGSVQRYGHDRDRHPYAQSYHTRAESQSGQSLRQPAQAYAQNHQRSGSSSSFNNEFYQTHSRSNSRSASPLPGSNNHQPRAYSPLQISNKPVPDVDPSRSGERTRSREDATSSASSMRSRSQSVSNINNPPISGANPQTAFIKIKIFDRVADDLIAIRVHPRVSHAELMEKIQARLGSEVSQLRYRESMGKNFVELQGDEDLRAWLAGTDKYVLFAD